MSSLAAPLLTLISLLRRLAAEEKPSARDAVLLADQAALFLDRLDPGDGADESLAGELAQCLAALAVPLGLPQDWLARLTGLGRMGVILAARLLASRDIAPKAAIAAWKALPQAGALAVADCFLSRPRLGDPAVAAQIKDGIDRIQAEDPEEVMVFLSGLSRAGLPAAYALQHRLLGGRFGLWLEKLLSVELRPDQVVFMAQVAAALSSERIAAALARLLDPGLPGFDQARRAVLAALVSCASPGQAGVIKRIKELLVQPECPLAGEAMAALIALRAPGAAAGLVKGIMERPGAGGAPLASLALGLDAESVAYVQKNCDPANRRWLAAALAAQAALLDPFWFAGALLQAKDGLGRDGQALDDALRAYVRDLGLTHPPPAPPRPDTVPRAAAPALPPPGAKLSDYDVSGKILKEGTLAGVTITGLPGAGAALVKMAVTASAISAADLTGAVIEETVFRELTLDGARLAGAHCGHCRFTQSVFANVCFDASTLVNVEAVDCRFVNCRFAGARLDALTAKRCVFSGCDFSGSVWTGTSFTGCVFSDCLFAGVRAEASQVRGGKAVSCLFPAPAQAGSYGLCGLDGDEPGFVAAAQAARRRFREDMAQRLSAPASGSILSAPAGLAFMERLAGAWLWKRDLARRERLMLANNARRLRWAEAKLGPGPAEFLTLLPGLVAAHWLPEDESPVPGLAIPGYAPSAETARLLAKLRGDGAAGPSRPGETAPAEAVYIMGSCGTIAQGAGSDIDVWVVIDSQEVPDTLAGRIKDKLSAISRFAKKTYALDAHFFLMDRLRILAGDFGGSDEESSGSAQSLLLLEEFYRTALLVAGRAPAWWHLPDRLAPGARAARLKRIQAAAGPDQAQAVDLGEIVRVSRGEYFGASLWQVVKALTSPFKSILKFALLDKYIHAEAEAPLLCEKIKRNILSGRLGLWETDPYALLFAEVYDYYRKAGHAGAVRLLTLAFRQKTGLTDRSDGQPHGQGLPGAGLMEFFYPPSDSAVAAAVHCAALTDEAARRAIRPSAFADLIDLSNQIGQFLSTTYESIQNRPRGQDERAAISDLDLTKIGRKLFSRLKPRPGKIMRLSFVSPAASLFPCLEFGRAAAPGQAPVFSVRGLPQGKSPETIRQDISFVRLAAWLAVNSVYAKHQILSAATPGPDIGLADIRDLIENVTAFFPEETAFERPLDEYLREERAVRALLVVNLLTPREETRHAEATAIYSTNWGEMFCQPLTTSLELMAKDPAQFLADNIPQKIGRDLELAAFLPAKARCPRPPFL